MNKLWKTLILAGSIYSVAYAEHKMNIESRVEMESKDQEFSKSGKASNNSIKFTHIRFKWAGDLPVDGMGYTFRWRVNKAGDDSQKYGDANGIENEIEYAYIYKKFDNGFKITFGKQFIPLGGLEDEYSGMDVYTYSQTSDNFSPGYRNTLALSQTFMDQEIILMASNPRRSEGDYSDRQFAYNISWYGDLMDGMIKPIIAYNVDPETPNSTTGKKGDLTSLGLGAQFNIKDLKLDVEYLMGEKDSNNQENTAIISTLRYKVGKVTPIVKYITEEKKIGTTKDKFSAFDVGVEYELAGKNRLHLVYSSQDFDYDVGNGTDYEATTIRAGIRINFDAYKL